MNTAKLHGINNITKFCGQILVLTFVWNVTEKIIGPAFCQLNNIAIKCTPSKSNEHNAIKKESGIHITTCGDGIIVCVEIKKF